MLYSNLMCKRSVMVKMGLYLALAFFCSALLRIDSLAQELNSKLEDVEVDEEHTWDFGDVSKEEVLSHTFTLKNEFGMILRILKVSTTCGCTSSKAKKDVLMPDEETSIDVVFDTKNYFGPVFHIISVDTNRFINPVIKFKIKANVVKPRIREGM